MCRQCLGGPGCVAVNGIKDAQSFVTLQFSKITWRAIMDLGIALLFAFGPKTTLRSRILIMKLKNRKAMT